MHSGVLKVASFTSFTKKSLGYFEISLRLSTSWKNEDVLTQFSWKQAEKCCFPSKKKSVQLRLSHQTKPLFTSSPAAPVFVCRVPLRSEQGLCRTRVSKRLLTSRIFFPRKERGELILSPLTPCLLQPHTSSLECLCSQPWASWGLL